MVVSGVEAGNISTTQEPIFQQIIHRLPEIYQALLPYNEWIAGGLVVAAVIVGINRFLNERQEEITQNTHQKGIRRDVGIHPL